MLTQTTLQILSLSDIKFFGYRIVNRIYSEHGGDGSTSAGRRRAIPEWILFSFPPEADWNKCIITKIDEM